MPRSQRFQDGQAESSSGRLLSCSDPEHLALVLMHTCTLFFCSSLGLLGCDILGPIDGSTPLRANSSKSTRSTNLSPYVKILNYIARATTDPFSPRGDNRTPPTRTFHEFLGDLPNSAHILVALPVAHSTHPPRLFSALGGI